MPVIKGKVVPMAVKPVKPQNVIREEDVVLKHKGTVRSKGAITVQRIETTVPEESERRVRVTVAPTRVTKKEAIQALKAVEGGAEAIEKLRTLRKVL